MIDYRFDDVTKLIASRRGNRRSLLKSALAALVGSTNLGYASTSAAQSAPLQLADFLVQEDGFRVATDTAVLSLSEGGSLVRTARFTGYDSSKYYPGVSVLFVSGHEAGGPEVSFGIVFQDDTVVGYYEEGAHGIHRPEALHRSAPSDGGSESPQVTKPPETSYGVIQLPNTGVGATAQSPNPAAQVVVGEDCSACEGMCNAVMLVAFAGRFGVSTTIQAEITQGFLLWLGNRQCAILSIVHCPIGRPDSSCHSDYSAQCNAVLSILVENLDLLQAGACNAACHLLEGGCQPVFEETDCGNGHFDAESGRCLCDSGYAACEGVCIHETDDQCGIDCVQCSALDGERCCDGECVNSLTSTKHCGFCYNPCPDGWICDEGQGCCPPGERVCNDACVDEALFQDDNLNCGACGRSCAEGTVCVAGDCTTASTGAIIVRATDSVTGAPVTRGIYYLLPNETIVYDGPPDEGETPWYLNPEVDGIPDGIARFEGISSGTYQVRALQFILSQHVDTIRYHNVEVAAGQATEVPFVLPPVNGRLVISAVGDSGQGLPPGFFIEFTVTPLGNTWSDFPSISTGASTDANGVTETNFDDRQLGPGEYEVGALYLTNSNDVQYLTPQTVTVPLGGTAQVTFVVPDSCVSSSCAPPQVYESGSCSCVCPPADCADGASQNQETCDCECPLGYDVCNDTCVDSNCPDGQVFDGSLCRCVGQSAVCEVGYTCALNPTPVECGQASSGHPCFCRTTIEGDFACCSHQFNTCGSTPTCSTSDDCDAGWICFASCCAGIEPGFCLPLCSTEVSSGFDSSAAAVAESTTTPPPTDVEMTPAPLAEPSPTEESVPTTEAPATG